MRILEDSLETETHIHFSIFGIKYARTEDRTVRYSPFIIDYKKPNYSRHSHFFSSESAIKQDKKRGRLVTRVFDGNLLRLAIFPLGGTRDPTLILFVTELILTRPTN